MNAIRLLRTLALEAAPATALATGPDAGGPFHGVLHGSGAGDAVGASSSNAGNPGSVGSVAPAVDPLKGKTPPAYAPR